MFSACTKISQLHVYIPLLTIKLCEVCVVCCCLVTCRLDPKGDGCISIEIMLRRLGITFSPQHRENTPPDQPTPPTSPALEDDGKSLKQLSGTERYILKNLHGNWGAVARSLQELDQHDTGKAS